MELSYYVPLVTLVLLLTYATEGAKNKQPGILIYVDTNHFIL